MATIAGSFPGMVTPQVTGSTYQNTTPEGERRMYQLEDERKRKREEANAQILAQRQAEQQARQEAQQKGQVWQAYQKMYGPQLQNLYHDTMVQREGASGPMGIPRKAPGGFTGSPFSSNVPFGSTAVPGQRGSVAPYRMDQAKLDQMLANMWTQATDPYTQAARQLGAGVMPQPPSGGFEAAGSGPGGGSRRRSSGKTTSVDKPLPTVEEWKQKYPR
jgi:hypothetical protein